METSKNFSINALKNAILGEMTKLSILDETSRIYITSLDL